jgi:hypothetical protein
MAVGFANGLTEMGVHLRFEKEKSHGTDLWLCLEQKGAAGPLVRGHESDATPHAAPRPRHLPT